MRVVAIILIVLGVVALGVPSFTFFTHERVADIGFFSIDASKPHTIILNPLVGIAAIVIGLFLFATGRKGGNTV
ncbi:MAG: DUF3185 domain-containing protein [Gemmataceae bacterium]